MDRDGFARSRCQGARPRSAQQCLRVANSHGIKLDFPPGAGRFVDRQDQLYRLPSAFPWDHRVAVLLHGLYQILYQGNVAAHADGGGIGDRAFLFASGLLDLSWLGKVIVACRGCPFGDVAFLQDDAAQLAV